MSVISLNAHQQIRYNPALISHAKAELFQPQYWQEQGKVFGSAQGRGTTWFVQTESIPAALRHYRRGGLWGKIIRDQYWFRGWAQSRSFAEFELLHYLAEQGVNVPRPLAAQVIKQGWFYRADLLSEFIADTHSLVDLLSQRRLSAEEYHKVGAEIRKMHRAQVNHTDLNIHNILLDKQGAVWLIDFDKCARASNQAFAADNLKRLKRSFLKEQKKRGIAWQAADFTALLAGYWA